MNTFFTAYIPLDMLTFDHSAVQLKHFGQLLLKYSSLIPRWSHKFNMAVLFDSLGTGGAVDLVLGQAPQVEIRHGDDPLDPGRSPRRRRSSRRPPRGGNAARIRRRATQVRILGH